MEGEFCSKPNLYVPDIDSDNRYFISVFGPRLRANDGAIDALYDFHRGEDIVDGDYPDDESTMPDVFCMCDGTVYKIVKDDSDLPSGQTIETTGEGKYVTVKCNATYNGNVASMGNVYTAYRHLSEINSQLTENSTISRGATIGKMGQSGVTTNNHLHVSAQRMFNNKLINVHPMRLFNTAFNKHLLTTIDAPLQGPLGTIELEQIKARVNITLLGSSINSTNPENNWAIFRIAVPYKKANIRAIVIKRGNYSATVDFEKISEERGGNTDLLDNPVVGNLKLFVYPFNRGQSAYDRFDSIQEALESEDHTGKDYPIPNTGIFTTPAYVIDIKAKGIPLKSLTTYFQVYVVDIWGKGVKGTL